MSTLPEPPPGFTVKPAAPQPVAPQPVARQPAPQQPGIYILIQFLINNMACALPSVLKDQLLKTILWIVLFEFYNAWDF